jgi:hypothetical protein
MVINFNEEQLKIIRKLNLSYNSTQELSDEECINLEEKIGDYYVLNCLDENFEPNKEGRICESILDLLSQG